MCTLKKLSSITPKIKKGQSMICGCLFDSCTFILTKTSQVSIKKIKNRPHKSQINGLRPTYFVTPISYRLVLLEYSHQLHCSSILKKNYYFIHLRYRFLSLGFWVFVFIWVLRYIILLCTNIILICCIVK